ncbi:MAG: hypothetical protein ABIO40_07700 [Devosia sp.]
MSSKEISAVVMVIGAIVVSAWVAWDARNGGIATSLSDAAWKMLWTIGYAIVFNVIAVIVAVIVVSIAQREEVKDERADERDRQVNNKAMRNAYFVLSLGVLGVLIAQATGLDAVLGPYALFAISMLAGAVFGASQFLYYRRG